MFVLTVVLLCVLVLKLVSTSITVFCVGLSSGFLTCGLLLLRFQRMLWPILLHVPACYDQP